MTNNKVRAVLLAALMVFSVFAGTVALTGSAAAATADSVNATDTAQDAEVTTNRINISNLATSGEETVNVTFTNTGGAEVVDASVSSGADISNVDTSSNNVTFNATAASDDVFVTVQWDTSEVTSDRTVGISVGNESGSATTGEFAISDISEVNDFAEAGSTFWRGQGVYFESSTDAQQTYQIREVDDDGVGSLVTEFTTNNNGVAVIDTDQQTIENGQEYVITTENREVVVTNNLGVQTGTPSGASASQYSWEVQQQTLSAEFEDSEVSAESEDPTTTVEIDSNRGSYGLTVSANDLDAGELEQIFDGGQDVIATDSDDETITIGSVSASDTLSASFNGIDQGDYQFTFEGADTSASAQANITVSDTEGQVTLPESAYSEQRGDVATITAEFQSTDDGYIEVGSDDVGYRATLEVTDGGDGEISVEMNTFLAGRDAGNESDVFSLTDESQDDDDTIEDVELHTNELGSPLEAGTYDIAAGTSVEGNTEDDLSTLDLQQRSTEDIQMWTAPADADYDELEELQSQVNQTNNIAHGDLAVVQLQASGIYGQLAASDNIQDALYNSDEGFMLTIEEANPGANQDAVQMAMNSSAVQSVYTDNDNNSLYVVVDTGVTADAIGGGDFDFDTDEEYTASFEINENNALIEDDEDEYGVQRETANQDFSITEATVEFDNLNDDDELELPASENAEISGTTSLAPGTELTIRVRSTDESGSSFLLPVEATVTENRTFSTTVDMSDREVGTVFMALVRQGGTQLTDVDGVVVEQVQTDTPDDTTTSPTTTSPTTTSTGETTTSTGETTTSGGDGGDGGDGTETTSTNTPGFGVIVALTALVAAALLAVRRDN